MTQSLSNELDEILKGLIGVIDSYCNLDSIYGEVATAEDKEHGLDDEDVLIAAAKAKLEALIQSATTQAGHIVGH